MNEWEFTGEVVSWINEALTLNPELPFARAKCEMRKSGSLKRRDISLLDKQKRVVLTGEIKLPYQKDGNSPYLGTVVKDARAKAARVQASFFFTWNVNQLVLWETRKSTPGWEEQDYQSWEVVQIHKESHLESDVVQFEIKKWLAGFLHDFARIHQGTISLGHKPLDEKYVEALESALQMPILLTFDELQARYQQARFKSELDIWMRDEQGWLLDDSAEGVRDNLERAAKFTCYALVNKLVFFEALLKRYGGKLPRIEVPDHLDKGDNLRTHLESYFAEARATTGDYETVFGEEHTAIGNRIPFYADMAVPHWRELIHQVHQFDFTQLDYEVIGSIFERLIAPEERHKYGQFYTRVEVVDLINSFCIRRGDEKVMDPACGGGTFLVRAYVRKRELDLNRKHGQLLTDLYGTDISHFATHLTTINLATRDLIDDENYPQIARSDFFDVEAEKTFVSLPTHIKTKGLGKLHHREIKIPPLDAVVGNPPYIEQTAIPKARKKSKKVIERGTKDYYQTLVKKEAGAQLSGRSDIHCYFWPHAWTLLKEDGYLCLITSSQWLDVDYGFKLQDWLLRHFQIVAVIESIGEPWFVGARVATTVTILRRQDEDSARMDNIVRFIQLRRPIRELLAHDGTAADAVRAADRFRDEILRIQANTLNDRYRARLIHQGNLWNEGVKLGTIMKGGEEPEEEEQEEPTGEYYGGKWGIYLRAPDIWFDIVSRFENKLCPLMELCTITYGIKSGKDDYFLPKDHTANALEEITDPVEFEEEYGISRKDVQQGYFAIVKSIDDTLLPIESTYIEPEIHSLMGVDDFVVKREDCKRMIVLAPSPRLKLKDRFINNYLNYGEKQGIHRNSTCAGRVNPDKEWYDLTGNLRPSLILPIIQQYRLFVFLNPDNLYINHALIGLSGIATSKLKLISGILNCTISILSRILYARILGNEGNIQLDVYSAKMMLVPNIMACKDKEIYKKVENAFAAMLKRKPLAFLSERRLRQMTYTKNGQTDKLDELSDQCELDMDDRRALDEAVLELLGVKSKRERAALLDELYHNLREFFERTRQKEEQAIANKKKAKRKGPAKPGEIAAQIYRELAEQRPALLRRYERDFFNRDLPFDTYEVPADGTPEVYQDMLIPNGVKFHRGRNGMGPVVEVRNLPQAQLLALVAGTGSRGLVRIPHEQEECQQVFRRFQKFTLERQQTLFDLIAERTADPDLQEKIYEALLPLLWSP